MEKDLLDKLENVKNSIFKAEYPERYKHLQKVRKRLHLKYGWKKPND